MTNTKSRAMFGVSGNITSATLAPDIIILSY